ncbi:hypothetical protein DdX_02169 [Ditylenchus destructor]|uniref:Uncharacterized protein n=1 Tax=Ditylenchus destructor TaxID=166010 RepID=A0AAD4RBT2_9BILA|nr:hypothetical protein DdX_02169 [Ditylenchus destructor]
MKKANVEYEVGDEDALSKGEFVQVMSTFREEMELLQDKSKEQANKLKKLGRYVDQLEFENRKLLLRVEGIPGDTTDLNQCLTEIMIKGVQLTDFKIEELQQYKFLPGLNKAGKKAALIGFKDEDNKKKVLENSKNLKDYRLKQCKIMISPFYTNNQQAIRTAQIATKKAVEIALQQYPDLLQGAKYLRPIGFEKLSLPDEKASQAKSYTFWKAKLIELGKNAPSTPYATDLPEYCKAFNDIIAAEKQI